MAMLACEGVSGLFRDDLWFVLGSSVKVRGSTVACPWWFRVIWGRLWCQGWPQIIKDNQGATKDSLRWSNGPSWRTPVPTTDRPRIAMYVSQIIPEVLSGLKYPGRCADRPGPPRITLDHHRLSRQGYESTTDFTPDCQIICLRGSGGIRDLGETEV